ncbi:MAG TPA: hypothetical protein VLT33_46380, partial [Labilithrix sp.]|nr:hypothetical protein [Labilithrix sp.]
MQGTPLQHDEALVHCWPYCAQVVLPSPPPPVGPPAAPHVPLVAPGAITHGSPAQQSAVVVHAAALGWHFTPTQTNGGAPDGFATHGKLQQSALDAQALP